MLRCQPMGLENEHLTLAGETWTGPVHLSRSVA